MAATTIDVVWPTIDTTMLGPLNIPPTTRIRKSAPATIRAGHGPYSTATAMAATRMYDGSTSTMRESDSGTSPCAIWYATTP